MASDEQLTRNAEHVGQSAAPPPPPAAPPPSGASTDKYGRVLAPGSHDVSTPNDGQHFDPGYRYNGPPPPEPGGGGSGYKCTVGDLRNAIAQVESMQAAAQRDLTQATQIASASPTASDPSGSVLHANGLKKWGQGLRYELQGYLSSLQSYRSKLNSVAADYSRMEEATEVDFNRLKGIL